MVYVLVWIGMDAVAADRGSRKESVQAVRRNEADTRNCASGGAASKAINGQSQKRASAASQWSVTEACVGMLSRHVLSPETQWHLNGHCAVVRAERECARAFAAGTYLK